ncbi:MAG: hypothetical protein D6796_00845 [Caldilineae bacterium]|nr:MAG: hypothetical protein D6796_00845 [Caldilineae bacterium]
MNDENTAPGGYNLRSGLRLSPAQQKEIETLLTRLVQTLPAHFLLLTDVTGQVVSARGGQNAKNLVALGSLVAGDLAASQEIARLTGQYQNAQMILRQGESMHTFITEAGHQLALLVQVPDSVPLGWARILIKNAAGDLEGIVTAAAEQPSEASPALLLEEENLPDLFDGVFDELWKG